MHKEYFCIALTPIGLSMKSRRQRWQDPKDVGFPSCMNLKVTDTYFTDSDAGVELYRKGRIFVIDDIYKTNLTGCHVELYERLKIKANVITPVVSGDKLLGL